MKFKEYKPRVCEMLLLNYQPCSNMSIGAIGQMNDKLETVANYHVCEKCYRKIFPNTSLGRN